MVPSKGFEVIEFFAGTGAVSRTMKYATIACASLDIDFGKATTRVKKQNSFDLLTPSGFAYLGHLECCFFI